MGQRGEYRYHLRLRLLSQGLGNLVRLFALHHSRLLVFRIFALAEQLVGQLEQLLIYIRAIILLSPATPVSFVVVAAVVSVASIRNWTASSRITIVTPITAIPAAILVIVSLSAVPADLSAVRSSVPAVAT